MRGVRLSIFIVALIGASAAAAADAPNAADAARAPPSAHGASAIVTKRPTAPLPPIHLVDINSASRRELKTLPGIGDAEADKIVANRPYLTKTELVTKQVLPTGPYLSLKSRIVAMQTFKPVAKSKGKG
jgi:DNA uptake protein ComE-like DNA-binding protein